MQKEGVSNYYFCGLILRQLFQLVFRHPFPAVASDLHPLNSGAMELLGSIKGLSRSSSGENDLVNRCEYCHLEGHADLKHASRYLYNRRGR